MLGWALFFFLIALVAAVFGFGGLAIAAAGAAQTIFWVFAALFLISLIAGLVGDRRPIR